MERIRKKNESENIMVLVFFLFHCMFCTVKSRRFDSMESIDDGSRKYTMTDLELMINPAVAITPPLDL